MAIDTNAEKLAILEWDLVFEPALPLLPGTAPFSMGEKQNFIWGYPGVLWGIEPEPTVYDIAYKGGARILRKGHLPEWWEDEEEPQPKDVPAKSAKERIAEAAAGLPIPKAKVVPLRRPKVPAQKKPDQKALLRAQEAEERRLKEIAEEAEAQRQWELELAQEAEAQRLRDIEEAKELEAYRLRELQLAKEREVQRQRDLLIAREKEDTQLGEALAAAEAKAQRQKELLAVKEAETQRLLVLWEARKEDPESWEKAKKRLKRMRARKKKLAAALLLLLKENQ